MSCVCIERSAFTCREHKQMNQLSEYKIRFQKERCDRDYMSWAGETSHGLAAFP